ncbi:MAG TPA: molybdopterin-guanine dinucleotide biosynthesis protein B [Microvirga sp.]|jgi:molybdopterin-guanine dinucleotide biosynthesis protein B
MRVIGLAGWSGAGKTTLLLKLIPELSRRGLAVSTLKHAHHAFDVDHPGKDSFEHRQAGAREVLIASGRRWALMHELRDEAEPALPDLLRTLSPVDLVIVEGFKAYAHPKVEIHRAANGKPLLYPNLANVRAILSDAAIPGAPVPVIPLDDVPAIADRLLAEAEDLAAVATALAALPRPARLHPRT